jgi:hypothetical protein
MNVIAIGKGDSTIPEEVMLALAGRWFGRCAMDGQMAFSICVNRSRVVKSSGQQIVRKQRSYLINALGSDEGLDTEPKHGQNNETDDAEIAEPESKRRASDDRDGYAEPSTDGASQHYDNRNG